MPSRTLVQIEIERHGSIQLCSDLTMGDIEVLHKLAQDKATNSRDFTVAAIQRLVYLPKLDTEEVRAWDDSELQRIILAWHNQTQPLAWEISRELEPFDAVEHGFELYRQNLIQEITESFAKSFAPVVGQINSSFMQFAQFQQAMIDTVQQSFAPAIKALDTGLADYVSSMRHVEFKVGQLFSNLPDLSEIGKRLDMYMKAADTIDAGGFPFLLRHWEPADLAPYAGIEKVDVRIRNAVVTNRLLNLTRRKEFVEELEGLFNSSSVLKRRWHIVEQALLAHRSRNYAVSIPTLLAQVEGIFTDALILKQLVVRVNGKLCARESSGNLKLDKKGKTIQLHGLGQKVDNSDLRNEYLLEGLAEFYTDHLLSDRNGILHGSDISYNKAKLSVQLVLNIYVLAAEFAYFEGETE